MFDTNSMIPRGGFLALVIFIYALIAAFITGPLIGERMIAKSGWEQQCHAGLEQAVQAQEQASQPVIPDLDCGTLLGPMFGRDGKAFCDRYGGGFKLPFMDQLEAQKRRAQELAEQALQGAAEQAGNRCACAVAQTLDDQRVPLAIAAGSLRLVVPRSAKDLKTSLQSSLGSRQCAMKG